MLPIGAEADEADPLVGMVEQDSTVYGNVLERLNSRRPGDQTLSSVARDGSERAGAAGVARRKPDLVA